MPARRFEITGTDEWRAILDLLREERDRLQENVMIAIGAGKSIDKMWGQYDGYRQVIEKLESLGGE